MLATQTEETIGCGAERGGMYYVNEVTHKDRPMLTQESIEQQ